MKFHEVLSLSSIAGQQAEFLAATQRRAAASRRRRRRRWRRLGLGDHVTLRAPRQVAPNQHEFAPMFGVATVQVPPRPPPRPPAGWCFRPSYLMRSAPRVYPPRVSPRGSVPPVGRNGPAFGCAGLPSPAFTRPPTPPWEETASSGGGNAPCERGGNFKQHCWCLQQPREVQRDS